MFYLFLRERETEHKWGGGAERETESEAGSRLWAVSTEPHGGLEPMNREIMTWAEVSHLIDRTTQAPLFIFILKKWLFIFEREREREREHEQGVAERDGDTETKAGSRLWAISPEPHMGLKTTNREIMTWAEVSHLTDWATQVPLV